MASQRRPTVTRACDSCRRRKVKCDASEACSNCRISHLLCQYTSMSKKRGPKVARIHNSLEEVCHTTTNACTRALQAPLPTEEDPIFWPDSQGQEGNEVFAVSLADTEVAPTTELARAIRSGLLQSMNYTFPSMLALNIINNCIDIYMKCVFPTAPYVHEPTLRASATRYFAEPSDVQLFCADSWQGTVEDMRAFALLTAACASVASIVPDSLLPYQQALAEPCLKASRAILKTFEDFDIEHPNSSSIITRALHSIALQQIMGKSAVAYHILGQATLLVQSMRLYSEDALRSHDALETQLLRIVFWQLYAADKASACLGNRPFLLNELLFDEELTLRPSGESTVELMGTASPWYEETLEKKLLVGFQLIPHLWSSAASLLFDLKTYGRGDEDINTKSRLTRDYMVFDGILDGLPRWLQASNLMASSEDGEVARFQKTAFWVQRCTIMVTYQCLRLVILQQCINSMAWDVMGLNGLVLTLAMAKIGIIHDFVQTLDDIPFIYLQVKGEPMVERIRWVGSVLLEMTCNVKTGTIKERAKHYFDRLLHILARLDSKASDEMSSYQM